MYHLCLQFAQTILFYASLRLFCTVEYDALHIRVLLYHQQKRVYQNIPILMHKESQPKSFLLLNRDNQLNLFDKQGTVSEKKLQNGKVPRNSIFYPCLSLLQSLISSFHHSIRFLLRSLNFLLVSVCSKFRLSIVKCVFNSNDPPALENKNYIAYKARVAKCYCKIICIKMYLNYTARASL